MAKKIEATMAALSFCFPQLGFCRRTATILTWISSQLLPRAHHIHNFASALPNISAVLHFALVMLIIIKVMLIPTPTMLQKGS